MARPFAARFLQLLFVFACLAAAGAEAAQPGTGEIVALDDIIVTAGRVAETPDTVGSSYTVITREEIELSQALYLHELLRDVPGVNIASDGALGGRTSIFLRGANNNHTAVMIDGVRVYDPIAVNAALDLSLLPPVAAVERIEIVRGPQSTLYGSDAIGGAINIITRRGDGPPRLTASFSGGSHNTWRPEVHLSGRQNSLAYNLSVSFTDSDGISRFDGREPDFYRRYGLSGHFSWQAADNLELGLNLHSWHARFGLDAFGADDPDYEGDNRFQAAGVYAEHIVNDKWLHRLTLARQKNLRHTANDPDPGNPTFERTRYQGDLATIDWQHNFFAGRHYTIVAGYARLEETGAAAEDFGFGTTTIAGLKTETDAFYIENRFAAGALVATLGGRADRHSIFGSHATWRATSAWNLPGNARIHASYGTGFKAPSIYQLFAPASAWGPIGNEALKPEKSSGWDAGLARTFTGENTGITLDATYFENRLRDLIDFDFLLGYINVARATTSGFEYSARAGAGPFFGRLAYTRLNAFNKTAGAPLLRRPKHAWHLQAGYRFAGRATVSLAVNRSEKRYDTEWPAVFRMDDYTTCDLFLDYRFNPDTRLFARVVNLFDEDYQEVFRYATEGRSFYLGVSRTW